MAIEQMDFLGQQLTRMAVNWRLMGMNRDDKTRQKQEFKPLLDKWGETRFQCCVDRCIREHATGFFPSIAEFMAFDNGAIGPQNIRTCPTCINSEGWAYLQDGNGRTRVTRCTHGRPA